MVTSSLNYTPAAAIGAAALVLTTLPVCVFPIVVLIRERASTLHHSHTQTPDQYKAFAANLAVWLLIVVCHIIMLVHALLAANEVACEYSRLNQRPLYGWKVFVSNCARSLLFAALDPVEAILSPIYPTTMLFMYVRILPTARQNRLKRTCKVFSAVLGFLSVSLFLATPLRRARMWTDNKTLLEMHPLISIVHEQLFNVWFMLMVLCAVVSVALCIKLLPHLRPRNGNSRSVNSSESDKRYPSMKAKPEISSPTSSLTHTMPVPSDSSAEKRIRACIRWLWTCLGIILALVLCNVGMVFLFEVDSVPQVAYTTLGWTSCHLISVSLFVATRMIKQSVMTRRLVPQSVAGTLAQSDWRGR